MLIKIKPLSINTCFKGRHFKTKEYRDYEMEMFYLLNKWKPKIYDKMEFRFTFGLRKNADIDNPLKPIIDILQKKYAFDDKNIMRLVVEKVIDKKGFIKIEIYEYK